MALPTSPGFPPPLSLTPTKRGSASAVAAAAGAPPSLIERLMRDAAEGVDVSAHLPELKRAILLDGLDADDAGMSAHRIYVWLLLLRAPALPYAAYAAHLARGASPAAAKIGDDAHRTLATDPLFTRRVSQNALRRLLNAVAWALHDAHAARAAAVPLPPSPALTAATAGSPPPSSEGGGGGLMGPLGAAQTPARDSPAGTPTHEDGNAGAAAPRPGPGSGGGDLYLQGMNVLAAPLLYAARSEPQAHTLLLTLLTQHVPSYVAPAMPGVHRGLALLARLLAALDPPLHAHLAAKGLAPSLYAFASVLTLSACTPPLPEALALWDFLFAWGVHLNLLAVVAQLVLMRDKLLASEAPARELRSLAPLRARAVIELVVGFVGRVEPGLWEEVVRHTEV